MKEFEVAYPIGHTPSQEELVSSAARQMGLPKAKVAAAVVVKRSLDARTKISSTGIGFKAIRWKNQDMNHTIYPNTKMWLQPDPL